MSIVLIIIAILLLISGFPLYLFFLAVSLTTLVGFMDIPLIIVAQTMIDSMNNNVLLAVPYFILAGEIMSKGKMTEQMVDFFRAIFGRVPGGMGIVTVISSAFFGAVSGSSPAAVATIGKAMHGSMINDGYGEKTTSGLICSSGNLAIIVPPSITMILYCSVVNVSVGKLFIAGILPAAILVVLLSAYLMIYSKTHNVIRTTKPSLSNIVETGRKSILTLTMPVIVLGGIYLGIFTPTEAAIVSVFYSAIVSAMLNKKFRLPELIQCIKSAARLTTQILIIMSAAAAFSIVLTFAQIPSYIVEILEKFNIGPIGFLIMVNIVFLVVGMFVDPVSAIVALMPLIEPIAQAQNIDLLHFGLIVVLNLSVGMCTPPFGLNLFTTMAILKTKQSDLVRGLVPFLTIIIITLLLITYIPSLFMWLPNQIN